MALTVFLLVLLALLDLKVPQGPQGATGPAGVAAGLSCNTNQVIRNNGSEWVCVTDPFANSCDPNQIIQWNGSAWVCADGYSQSTRRTLLGSIGWGYDLQSGPTRFCCAQDYDQQLCDPLSDESYQVCDNDRGPVQRDCSPTVSTYYCAERIDSCDGAGCDAVPSCKADDAACRFTLSGAGLVTCDLDSECSVRGTGGRVENAVICKAGATCSGSTGTSDSTLFMYCEAGSSCNGTASTGDALTVMVCADGSTCTGGPSTGSAIVRQACEAGATCTCTPGISNSQCLTDTYTNYTWPQQ